ncbi:hypothetical protein GR635_27405, partial [Klebsiella pneumoniae]|nr:hypothetical protein [Klebsiella pneumoniae]
LTYKKGQKVSVTGTINNFEVRGLPLTCSGQSLLNLINTFIFSPFYH